MIARTLKYASLLMAAVMLISCQGQQDPTQQGSGNGKGIELTVDKVLIQADGADYATLSVTLDGQPVTENVIFFDAKDNVLDIADFKFSTETPGNYEIWANYGTYNTNKVLIRALSAAIPETPADPQPSSTSFKSRVMCMQFTGTACGYCSQFMERLRDAFEDEAFGDEYVKAAFHTYSYSASYPDPAYMTWNWSDRVLGVQHPLIVMDYTNKYALYASTSADEFKGIVRSLNEAKQDVACGIAVNSALIDGQIVAKVTVKAAEEGTYRVGAILLEDGLIGNQINGEAWMKVHNACARYIDAREDSANGTERWYGFSLGNIAKGKTADYLFVWNLQDIWDDANTPIEYWQPFVEENLRMAVFVTTTAENDRGEQYFYVNNAVNASVNGETPFAYR